MRFVGLQLASTCFAVAVLAAASVVVGCRNPQLGQPCDLGTAPAGATGGAQIVTISSPALECPSRICLGGTDQGGTGGLCTTGCESDTDCEDAVSASRCVTGFACAWPTTVGDFACQRLCVCRDFITVPPGGFQKPVACP